MPTPTHQLSETQFQQQAADLEQALTHHLRDRLLRNDNNQRLLNGVGVQHDRGNVLRFSHDPRLEPTNNRAERTLRPAVIRRKVSHCSKTEREARAFETFLSVIQTNRQRSPGSLCQALLNLFSASGLGSPH